MRYLIDRVSAILCDIASDGKGLQMEYIEYVEMRDVDFGPILSIELSSFPLPMDE